MLVYVGEPILIIAPTVSTCSSVLQLYVGPLILQVLRKTCRSKLVLHMCGPLKRSFLPGVQTFLCVTLLLLTIMRMMVVAQARRSYAAC